MAVDVADRHPRDKRALILESAVEGQREVSWGEIQDRSRQIAATLQAAGIRKGDRVAVLLPQRADTPAAYLGVLRTGAILVTMSLLWAAEPIRFRLEDSGASVIIAEASAKALFDGYEGTFIDIDSPADRRGPDRVRGRRDPGRRPRPDLLYLGHHRPGQGNRPRPPDAAGPQRVRVLPPDRRRRRLLRRGGLGLVARQAHGPAPAWRHAPGLPACRRLRPRSAAGQHEP